MLDPAQSTGAAEEPELLAVKVLAAEPRLVVVTEEFPPAAEEVELRAVMVPLPVELELLLTETPVTEATQPEDLPLVPLPLVLLLVDGLEKHPTATTPRKIAIARCGTI